MNIYRYKNNVKLNIFNVTLPEADGHIIVLLNVETLAMRIWKFATWGGLTYYTDVPIVEITEFSEELRQLVIKRARTRLARYHDKWRPNGAWELAPYLAAEFDSRNPEHTGTKKHWSWLRKQLR